MRGRNGTRSTFTASWKVTESKEARVITQKSERSYLSSVLKRTEENGRKVVSLDTSEARDGVVRGVGLLHKGNQIHAAATSVGKPSRDTKPT